MTKHKREAWQRNVRRKQKAQPVWVFSYPTHKLRAIRFCLMPDGDRRYVRVNTLGKNAAYVKIGGKTVSGTIKYHPNKGGDYSFHVNPNGVNAALVA